MMLAQDSAIQTGAKYGPALLAAPLGAIDPMYGAIVFGMVTGWLALAGVLFDADTPPRRIGKAMIVSVLIGGGGALFAAFAVERLHLSTLGAAIVAFGIAFGGVKSIKLLAGGALNIAQWVFRNIADDAEKAGRARQEAQLQMNKNRKDDLERMAAKLDEKGKRDEP